MIRTERRGRYCFVIYINATLSFLKGFDGNYRPQPKDGKGNIFSLFTPGGLPQSQPGTPILTWPGGLPQFSPGWGVALSWSTSPPRTGLSPGWDWGSPQHWDRGTPKKGAGTRDLEKNLEIGLPLERTWDQTPGKEPGTGVPPVNGHTPVKTFLPHPLDAGGNKLLITGSRVKCLA